MDHQLLRELEEWKAQLLSEVISLYQIGDPEQGRFAFNAWKRRFIEFLRRELPNEYPESPFATLSLMRGVSLEASPLDNFMKWDGSPTLAYLDHLLQEIRRGRLVRSTSPPPVGASHPAAIPSDSSRGQESPLPSGTVTFLFSDIEGSTSLWERHRSKMRAVIERHDRLMDQCVQSHRGSVVKRLGDGVHAVFSAAPDALAAVVAVRRQLHSENWSALIPELTTLPVRMALYTGTASMQDGDYHGPDVNRAARLMASANGDQIFMALVTQRLVCDSLPEGVDLLDLGEHTLRDVPRPEHIYQVVISGIPTVRRPPATTGRPTHLDVSTVWETDPYPDKGGYNIVLTNTGSSTVKALKVQGELQPEPFGFAKPKPGWYNPPDIRRFSAALEPPDLHPSENRVIARIRVHPPQAPVEAEALSAKLTIFSEDHKPLEVELDLPTALYQAEQT